MNNKEIDEMVTRSFCRWFNGEVFSEYQNRWLRENTNFEDYNDLHEFYKDLGFLDENGTLTEIGEEAVKAWSQDTGSETAQSVGTQEDDRLDPAHEPARMTLEEWTAGDFYAVEVKADPGDAAKTEKGLATGYQDYVNLRNIFHDDGYFIVNEDFQTKAEYLPGLLTFDAFKEAFEDADDDFLYLPSFPEFCKRMKIKTHDTIILAADTGAGKSSLAINFLNDLNDRYPVLYVNLEMDKITILRRLVAIRTGLEIDRIEGYKNDEQTREAVDSALDGIACRKPLQLIEDAYYLEDLEKIIDKSTAGREEPTIVIIDHALLMKTKKRNNGSYERASEVSEGLRRISRKYNVIMFSLLQQNRAGKGDGIDTKRPTNSSLKDSGSWENDSTHVIFLWYDPEIRKKKIIITKNRSGEAGDFILNYWSKTQTYTEAKEQPQDEASSRYNSDREPTGKQSKRDKKRAELSAAYEKAITRTGGDVTVKDLAEILDVTTGTVKRMLKEYGGFSIDGQPFDPAGMNNVVEDSFIRLTPANEAKEGVPFPN